MFSWYFKKLGSVGLNIEAEKNITILIIQITAQIILMAMQIAGYNFADIQISVNLFFSIVWLWRSYYILYIWKGGILK